MVTCGVGRVAARGSRRPIPRSSSYVLVVSSHFSTLLGGKTMGTKRGRDLQGKDRNERILQRVAVLVLTTHRTNDEQKVITCGLASFLPGFFYFVCLFFFF